MTTRVVNRICDSLEVDYLVTLLAGWRSSTRSAIKDRNRACFSISRLICSLITKSTQDAFHSVLQSAVEQRSAELRTILTEWRVTSRIQQNRFDLFELLSTHSKRKIDLRNLLCGFKGWKMMVDRKKIGSRLIESSLTRSLARCLLQAFCVIVFRSPLLKSRLSGTRELRGSASRLILLSLGDSIRRRLTSVLSDWKASCQRLTAQRRAGCERLCCTLLRCLTRMIGLLRLRDPYHRLKKSSRLAAALAWVIRKAVLRTFRRVPWKEQATDRLVMLAPSFHAWSRVAQSSTKRSAEADSLGLRSLQRRLYETIFLRALQTRSLRKRECLSALVRICSHKLCNLKRLALVRLRKCSDHQILVDQRLKFMSAYCLISCLSKAKSRLVHACFRDFERRVLYSDNLSLATSLKAREAEHTQLREGKRLELDAYAEIVRKLEEALEESRKDNSKLRGRLSVATDSLVSIIHKSVDLRGSINSAGG